MKRSLAIMLLILALCATSAGQDTNQEPTLTGIAMRPIDATQCHPVRVMFTLRNDSPTGIYSQRPYSGAGYNLYQSFADHRYNALPDRYMVGVSLNGGADGYPYRWGFRGMLIPGRTTTVAGNLTLLELGGYELTGAILKGGVPLAGSVRRIGRVNVSGCAYVPPPPPPPVPARPIYPVVNGQYGYAPYLPYTIGGYSYVQIRPFIYNLGMGIYTYGNSVTIYRPGYELVLYPGSQYGYLNRYPISMPAPVYRIGDIIYIAPTIIAPLLGASVYWDRPGHRIYMYSPWGPGYW